MSQYSSSTRFILEKKREAVVEPLLRTTNGLYVQYGCGHTAPEGWQNFDSSPTLRWEKLPILGKLKTKNPQPFPARVRFGDVVKGLPIADGSCAGVYASHVLEHLTLKDFHLALANTKRIMKPGGIFRAIVPDLESFAREYLDRLDNGDATASEIFMDQTGLGKRDQLRGLFGYALHLWSNHSHHWMWDWASLLKAFTEHGFVDLRRCSFGDCEDPMFSVVEHPQRFERAVAIEARAS